MRVRGEMQTVQPEAWANLLAGQLTQHFRERAFSWERYNLIAPPVEEMLERVVTLLPPAEPNVLDEQIGPFYDTAGVQTVLGGVTKQAVEARRKSHRVLAVKTSDGRWVYPTWQFGESDVHPALAPAIREFQHAPAWSAALWFVTPNPDLGEVTPLVWANEQRPQETLTASARRTAYEWR